MKVLVVYDSVHGNTEKIARAIGKAIGCQVLRAAEVNPVDLKEIELLIVGSPTHGGSYRGWFTTEIKSLLNALPDLEGVNIAAFDTRTKLAIFGFAAPWIARYLENNGGNCLIPPEGFFVLDFKGPLMDGELKRAASWAQGIVG